jgi:hypothetical protein
MSRIEEGIVVGAKVPRSKRILAFDILRGLFLLIIMIDHIELYPSGWDFLTGKGRLWVSAAEGFFFISGLLIGMVYKRRLPLGMKFIFKKMWARAAELYVVGVGLTLLFLVWAFWAGHPNVKDVLPSPFDWHHYIKEALLMRFTFGWADFLVRFAILMIFAPIVFYLVAKRLWWLALVGSLGFWLFRGQGFTLSWQLIFNIGIIVGFYWNQLQDMFRALPAKTIRGIKYGLAAAAGLTFIASYSSVYVLNLMNWLWGRGSLPDWAGHLTWTWDRLNYDVWVYADKWTMGPVRIVLFFIWFPVIFWLVRRYEYKINKISRGAIDLIGKNSLFVYTIHAFIVFIFKVYVIPPKTGFWENFVITTSGLMLLVLITLAYKYVQPTLAAIPHRLNKLSFSKN